MSTVDPPKTRRTEGVLTGGRSARIVDGVLEATAEELSRVGYAALRIEEVAERSGVNKTTIYRRWPTKSDLVRAALEHFKPIGATVDTGDLREDLLAAIRELVEFCGSPTGRGLVRVLQMERADPEVEAITQTLRARQRKARAQMIERAIARGELPPSTRPELVVELVFAPVSSRILSHGEQVDDAFAHDVIDTILAGLRTRAAANTSSGA
jgi:AcrR family transcriptional regulator